jgi:hypothetical protein
MGIIYKKAVFFWRSFMESVILKHDFRFESQEATVIH